MVRLSLCVRLVSTLHCPDQLWLHHSSHCGFLPLISICCRNTEGVELYFHFCVFPHCRMLTLAEEQPFTYFTYMCVCVFVGTCVNINGEL